MFIQIASIVISFILAFILFLWLEPFILDKFYSGWEGLNIILVAILAIPIITILISIVIDRIVFKSNSLQKAKLVASIIASILAIIIYSSIA